MPEELKKNRYKNPIPTVDIILTKSATAPREILIETRGRTPFDGYYSLPGGHVEYGETVEAAVLRELKEECGVRATLTGILGVYSDPKRDPRGQRITTVFLGHHKSGLARGGDDTRSAEWIRLEDLLRSQKIAFDHRKILNDYVSLMRARRSETFWSTKKWKTRR